MNMDLFMSILGILGMYFSETVLAYFSRLCFVFSLESSLIITGTMY